MTAVVRHGGAATSPSSKRHGLCPCIVSQVYVNAWNLSGTHHIIFPTRSPWRDCYNCFASDARRKTSPDCGLHSSVVSSRQTENSIHKFHVYQKNQPFFRLYCIALATSQRILACGILHQHGKATALAASDCSL